MQGNIGQLLHRWAVQDPKRTGIVDASRNEVALSYGALDDRAGRVAASLGARGLGPGDRVAICTANGLEFVAAWFGAVYAGCATLPVPVGSTSPEIALRLRHAGCRAIVADADRMAVAKRGVEESGGAALLLSVADLLATTEEPIGPIEVPHEAFAMLLYTSGTTGAPKCACITHGSLGAHTAALAERVIDLEPDDCVLGTLPLTHSYGIRTTLLVPFHAGARTVFVPKFSPRRTLELCQAQGVTWIPAVPTMFIGWASQTDAPTPSRLRWCMSAGAPLTEDVRLRAEQRLGAPVRQAYGLTEANLTAINAPPDDAVPGSSGQPVPGVEVRIASEGGLEVRHGQRGEVLVRGPNVMAGYLDDRMATEHVMRDGWLHTGDVGLFDSEGRLSIVDRSKDLILRGGASIYPSEVESVLSEHPGVHDVAVIGRPHEYYGEEVVAIVVADESVNGAMLDEYAHGRLADYKCPREHVFVDSLPRGGSGKTLKRRLREELAAGTLTRRV